MTIPTTETLPRTECPRSDEMKKPDDFSTLLKLKSLGWGEAGVRRSSRAPSNDGHGGGDGVCVAQATAAHVQGTADGLEARVKERFCHHVGNADVVRQELAAENSTSVSLRTAEQAVAHLRHAVWTKRIQRWIIAI